VDSIYHQLARHLDKLPVPFPATESGVEIRILERWFSEDEVKIALAMTGLPEQASVIAQRLGTDPASLDPVLDAMSRKGLIFRASKGEKRSYSLVPLAEGMWEFHIYANSAEDTKVLREYLDIFMQKGWYGTKTTQHRIVPISQSLDLGMEIMPYDRAEEIIKVQKKIAVAHCICRREQRLLGKGCNHPSEACMVFGTGAYFYIENGLGREVSTDEALKILHEAMDAGLVLQPGNGQKVWNICMCCGCCCSLLNALKKMDKPGKVAHTNFYAEVSEGGCSACGVCADCCPMSAISIDEVAVVDPDRCIGCGVCVGTCHFDALQIRQKGPEDRYVPPADVMEMQLQIAKERGIL